MLSYLKDGQNQTPATAQVQDRQINRTSGLCQQDDFLTVSGHGKKLRQSTMMLAFFFAVAASCRMVYGEKDNPGSRISSHQ